MNLDAAKNVPRNLNFLICLSLYCGLHLWFESVLNLVLIMCLCVQSDLLVVKKKNKRYCPIYFQKVCLSLFFSLCFFSRIKKWSGDFNDCMVLVQEDIERELLKVSRASRGTGLSQHIMVRLMFFLWWLLAFDFAIFELMLLHNLSFTGGKFRRCSKKDGGKRLNYLIDPNVILYICSVLRHWEGAHGFVFGSCSGGPLLDRLALKLWLR